MMAVLAVGCSLKEDPDEVLPMSGNHSPGELAMVTTDTSSDGYHYLEAEMSPDGTRLAFTADWPALPPPGQPPEEIPTIRSLVVMGYQPGSTPTQPLQQLAQAGASLVPMVEPVSITVGGSGTQWLIYPLRGAQKGAPTWLDDQTLVFWMRTERGDRLFRADLTQATIFPELVYYEPEDLTVRGRYWHHHEPALSPDRQWVAFSRFGGSRSNPDSIQSYTLQEIWVARLNGPTPLAFPVTTGVTMIGGPAWSPDGTRLAFHATLELQGGGAFYGTELFSVEFDTTGLAATGGVALNRALRRLTFTSIPEGNPIPIANANPSWSADGRTIIFASTRRAPTITLHDRSIWRIPSDGSLEPVIAFFSREDDVDAQFLPGSSNEILLSSAMGFPTEMLDRLEREARERLRLEYPEFNDVQINELAAAERQELEYFQRVMTHLFVFRGW
jgi:hypothetical protein